MNLVLTSSSTENPFLAREFDRASDYEDYAAWARGHKRKGIFGTPLRPEALPPLGVVVSDRSGQKLAMLWLHLSVGVGVSFLEHVTSRPGLSLQDARAAILYGIGALKHAAAQHDYGVMLVRTYPALARVLERAGFHSETDHLISLSTLTR